MILRGSRYTPWFPLSSGFQPDRRIPPALLVLTTISPALPAGLVLLTKATQTFVPPPDSTKRTIFVGSSYPTQLMGGYVWRSEPPVDPPIYSSPPSNQVLVTYGYPQPNVSGSVVQLRTPPKDDPVKFPFLVINGYSQPNKSGAATWFESTKSLGEEFPNTFAYAAKLIAGYDAPNKAGYVWTTPWAKGIIDTSKPGGPLNVVPGWQPTPSGNTKFLNKFAQIDHDLQEHQLWSAPKVVSYIPSARTYYAGSVWSNISFEAAPQNQQKLSAFVSNGASNRVPHSGSISLFNRTVEYVSEKTSSMAVYGSYGPAQNFSKVWWPIHVKQNDKLSGMLVVLSTRVVNSGAVVLTRPVRAAEKLSPYSQVMPRNLTPTAGSVQAWQQVKYYHAGSNTSTTKMVYAKYQHTVHSTGYIRPFSRARLYTSINNDFLWSAGRPFSGWSLQEEVGWQLNDPESGWTIGEPKE